MGRVLISVDKLESFDNVCINVLDIIDHFLSLEWHVDVVTQRYGGVLTPSLDQRSRSPRFRLSQDAGCPLQETYDLTLIFQCYLHASLISALKTGKFSSQILFRHRANSVDLNLPLDAVLENRLAWRVLSLAKSMDSLLKIKGIDETKLFSQPDLVPDAFLKAQPRPDAPATVLYMADQFSAEMSGLQQQLSAREIRLVWLDTSSQLQPLDEKLFNQVSLVVGDEHIVSKALSCGLPVFLATQGRVEGYVLEHNLTALEEVHFSALNAKNRPDAEEWAEMIVEGYLEARDWTASQQEAFACRWGQRTLFANLLDDLPAPAPIVINEKEYQALSLHRRVMDSGSDEDYSTQKWLEDRQPSATRISVLHSFIGSLPHTGNIALTIVDNEGYSDAVQRTLDSLASQHLMPASVTVLSSENAKSESNIDWRIFNDNWVDSFNQLVTDSEAHSMLVVTAGTLLQPQALLLFAEYQMRNDQALMWYCDEMSVSTEGHHSLVLKPDNNIDLLRSMPYIGSSLLFNLEAARLMQGLDRQFTRLPLVDLAWRVIESAGPQALGHIPEVLVTAAMPLRAWLEAPEIVADATLATQQHLQRFNISATLEAGATPAVQRVRYTLQSQPRVSIIIPTRDHLPLLRRCIESLMEKTRYPDYELLIVDNQSQEKEACDFLDQLAALNLPQLKVLRWPHPFNFSAINNFAAAEATGEVLLFLNNDIEVTEENWLEALVEHIQRPEIGIVSGRLEYADGRVQHGGLVVGVQDGVGRAFEGCGPKDPGYLYYLQAAHNVTAVSGACLMIGKALFNEINGFSEQDFPVWFGDVDLALRVKQLGYLTVWTPYCRLKHMGGATRLLTEKFGTPAHPEPQVFDTLRKKWGGSLVEDISYHPAMNRQGKLFSLSENMGRYQPPLPGRPLPVMLAGHVNWYGCGNHRVIQPFKALEENLAIDGSLTLGIPGVMEMARLQPDTILLELATGTGFPRLIEQYRQVSKAKIIVEYDDYLPNVPLKNGNKHNFPQHIIKRLRRVVEAADWVVLSTYPLAEAYHGFHPDIRVAQNRLAVSQWGHLQSERRVGKKPRVGWAGGNSHAGDLDILRPIIKALEDRVEWVFMGMKPEGVKCEFHASVPFDYYPEKLASLNLDLALVPLEHNHFNECKSNLRLLEIGACGVPIIATDIVSYRCGLPVTLVPNRFKDWMNAINNHLGEWEALSRQGDELRTAIHQDWFLRDHGLDEWRKAWLP
ncbi:glycosyltransferase [Erwinia sp. E_sp_B04_7]